jgi:AraC family transcriptional regulator
MSRETQQYYRQKVNDVLNYVHNHLSDDLNVKLLSEQFGFSHFHFHRILKEGLNEPLGSYINRIRLETAVTIIRNSDLPLSDIASLIGYSDCSAFSKAFSREFGLSPLKFKTNKTIVLNTHIDFRINAKGDVVSDIRPKIVILADRFIVYKKFKGDYTGKGFSTLWDNFWENVTQPNILSWKPDIFSVYYDDPYETAADDCRAECCIATCKTLTGNLPFETRRIAGGKFAMFRYKGPHKRLLEINEYLLREWIINSDLKFRDSYLIEKYINNHRYTEQANLVTEIYLPIL